MRFKTTLCFLILSAVTVITAKAQFTSGSGIVYTTNTTDKVSIGTTTPGAKLDVKGSGRFTDAVAATSGIGLELDYQIPSDYARILAYDRTNGVYKSLKINGSVLTLNDISNGNVGIGTGTPGVKLDVKGSGRFTDAGAASSGIGLELDYIVASDYGRILSYDRTNSAYKPLRLNGSSLFLNDMSKGNVSVGPVSTQGSLSAFQVHQANVLGSTAGNFIDISTLSGTGGTANRLMSKLWVVRDNAGSDWTTARLHEGVTVDATYTTPMVDTRTWWERDPYNNIQSWGTGGNTYMTLNAGKIGIGTTTPASLLHVQTSNNGLNIVSGLHNLNGTQTGGNAVGIGFLNEGLGNWWKAAIVHERTGAYGIGSLKFLVNNSGDNSTVSLNDAKMTISSSGYVGIGVANPEVALDVTPSIAVRGGSANIHFKDPAGSTQFQMGLATSAGGYCNTCQPGDFVISKVNNVGDLYFTNNISGAIHFKTGTSYATSDFVMSIVGSNVLIGKTSQSNANYKLDVNGNIRANKIVVNTTGADFVFEPNYELPSLQSVEAFIKKYHHLPGIASASEMQSNGLDVGEHQSGLLQKTEELTLYIIEQNKLIKEQNKKIELMEMQIHQLQKSFSQKAREK